ncbi:hypothetical protein OIU84_022491 [Salix udensis]|uniref:Uncharacterized protein n=1 Tax=Salix udensis TaxID=889485 RepID=A0AAD6KR23_9ROSI|nr:hypothetical protein OIU84_022491 [Salix udensis]
MVLVKAMLESLLLFLLLLTSSVSVHSVAGEAVRKNNVAKSYRSWRRINHGSARGPPKHLVNPAVEHPFEVPKFRAIGFLYERPSKCLAGKHLTKNHVLCIA